MNKRFVIGFFLIALAFQLVYSQEEPTKGSSTKIKSSLSEKGRIYIEDFFSLGTIKGSSGSSMEISAMVIYEPGKEAERLRGLKISVIGDGTDKRTGNVFLDYDEIENLNKVVVYMIQVAATWKYATKDSSEATFSTKDNFRFGFFQRATEQVCFAECWNNGKISGSFDIENLKTVKLILDQAKNILSVK
jgi:hypothetical protein